MIKEGAVLVKTKNYPEKLRKYDELVTACVGTAFWYPLLKKMDETGRRRRLKSLLDGLEESRAYRKLKEEALDLPVWRTDFGIKRLWTFGRQTAWWRYLFRYLPERNGTNQRESRVSVGEVMPENWTVHFPRANTERYRHVELFGLMWRRTRNATIFVQNATDCFYCLFSGFPLGKWIKPGKTSG